MRSINEFVFSHTTVQGIDKSGKNYSAVIDLEGNEMLRTPYSRLIILNEDSSFVMFNKKDLYGLMNLQGQVVAKAKYTWIRKVNSINSFVFENEESTFVAPSSQPNQLTRIGPLGSFEFFEGEDLKYSMIDKKGTAGRKYYYSFDKNGTPLKPFEGISISKRFNGRKLPGDFMSLCDLKKEPCYIVNARTGKMFKQP